MAYGNDVIDLLGLAADKFLSGAVLAGTDLVLTMNDGAVYTVPLDTLPDDYIISGFLDPVTEIITFNMNLGGTVDVDLSALPDEYLTSAVLTPAGVLEFNMAIGGNNAHNVDLAPLLLGAVDTYVDSMVLDGLTGILTTTLNDPAVTTYTIDIGAYMAANDVYVNQATYNCLLEQIELRFTDPAIPMVPVDMTCFATSMAALERGGVAFDAAKTYAPGDIVGSAGQAYISLTGASSSPAANPADWAPLTVAERGGVLYLPTNTYSVGDMVSSAGIGYISLTGLSSDPATNPTDWITVASDERGGIAHNMTLSYLTGDTVIRNNRLYIAQAANTGVDPAGDPVTWREYNTVMHTAVLGGSAGGSLHNPTGDSYPAPTGETIGATWTINGLGAGTTFTYGAGSLAGVIVKDGDYLSWAEGPDTAPVWMHIPKAVMTAERGGVAWSTATDYLVSDIVVDPIDGEIYKCIANSLATVTPPSLSIEWARSTVDERAGMVYDPTVQYELGDVVSIGDELYIIGEDPANPGNPMPIGGNPSDPADSSTPNPIGKEIGGIVWNIATEYKIGDIVSEGIQIYVCIVPNNGNLPSIAPGSWALAESALVVERGGVAWDVSQPYVVGDVVTDGAGPSIYVCILANTGDTPAVMPTSWYDATSQFIERGGIAWDATASYISGDITVQNTQLYIALVNTVNDDPGLSPNEWELYGVERGGIQWRPAQDYNIDDTAVDPATSLLYIALTVNIGSQPSLTVGTDWKLASSPSLFDPTLSYNEGDIVAVGEDLYIAPPGGVPAGLFDPSLWYAATAEGDLWVNNINYEIGDIVSFGGIAYVALTAGIALQPDTNPVNWRVAERGGIAWNTLTPYVLNDIAVDTIDGLMYRALTTHSGTQPSTDVTNTDWMIAAAPERGGVLWNTLETYIVGDVVVDTIDNFMYRAVAIQTGNQPSTDAGTNWVIAAAPERGGVMWRNTEDYQIGDIVIDNIDGLMYKSIVVNTAIQPSLSPATWDLFANDEKGGIKWNNLTAYAVGDIVSEGVGSYVAILASTGSLPSTSPTIWNRTNVDYYVGSKTAGSESRISTMVSISQVNYDAIVTKDPNRLYIIIG